MVSRGFTVSMRLKDVFFDRPAVRNALKAPTKKALSKAGAFIQRRARSSMRRKSAAIRRKGKIVGFRERTPSPAGSPPFAWSRDKFATLKNILFGYDENRESVIVGPVGFGRKEVPALHEFGGTAKRTRIKFRRRGGRNVPIKEHYTARYPARPFMGPALAAEAPKLPPLFRGVLGRGG
jgi:phage gpG-like protein